REHIAIAEATRLGIPVIAICDTNSNPDLVDYAIPANDDAFKSISLITLAIGKAVEEGLLEREQDKEDQRLAEEEEAKRAADEEEQRSGAVVEGKGEEHHERGRSEKRKRPDIKANAEAED